MHSDKRQASSICCCHRIAPWGGKWGSRVFFGESKTLFWGAAWFTLHGAKRHPGTCSRCFSFFQNPVHVLDHVGVDAGAPPLSTAVAPTGDAHQTPDLVVFAGQGASRVSLGQGGEKGRRAGQFRRFSFQPQFAPSDFPSDAATSVCAKRTHCTPCPFKCTGRSNWKAVSGWRTGLPYKRPSRRPGGLHKSSCWLFCVLRSSPGTPHSSPRGS